MNKVDKEFKRKYPHIYRFFQTCKFHHIDFPRLQYIVMDLYKCQVNDLTIKQAEELMFRIHYASPRKEEHRKWHK